MIDKKPLQVEEALARVLAGARPLGRSEHVPLSDALDRTLGADIVARRTQPPEDVSAMDGYAVIAADLASPGARLRLIGESAAGHGFAEGVKTGECVRIFTGAPVPPGADTILLQEDAIVENGLIGANEAPEKGRHVRVRGLDFAEGRVGLAAGTRLSPAHLALAAAMDHAELCVAMRPRVAIIASGDELAPPGETTSPTQIVSSNNFAVAGLVAQAGGEAVDLGIFRDDLVDLARGLQLARTSGADVIVTIGGASVGDHDLLRQALSAQGMSLDFWRIAMRPGKPLIFGRLGDAFVLGLPGNPAASFVCALLFLAPLIRALLGDPSAGADKSEIATLGVDLPANKARRDYMRAGLARDAAGWLVATPQPLQDSSLLTELVASQALLIREIGAPAAQAGDPCRIMRL
ncbi:MAG TPA: gephyrin-like molybdotransferase Glp [Methylocystis sp.]|nr:gephyrin-like molybdotransferase Glp [Methylocystis sp.]